MNCGLFQDIGMELKLQILISHENKAIAHIITNHTFFMEDKNILS